MKQIQDIFNDIRELNFSAKEEPVIIYNESCKCGYNFYTVTIFVMPGQLKLYVIKYTFEQYYDSELKEICMNSSNSVIFNLNPDEDVRYRVISKLIDELKSELVPILDDNLCFSLNDHKYRLDYCQGMTHILLIFQVDEVGTPMSSDFICREGILESGKPIPIEVYEFLTDNTN